MENKGLLTENFFDIQKQACCATDKEYETFRLWSTGGKNAITTMSLRAAQIVLPEALMGFLDILPTQNELAHHRMDRAKWMPVKTEEQMIKKTE